MSDNQFDPKEPKPQDLDDKTTENTTKNTAQAATADPTPQEMQQTALPDYLADLNANSDQSGAGDTTGATDTLTETPQPVIQNTQETQTPESAAQFSAPVSDEAEPILEPAPVLPTDTEGPLSLAAPLAHPSQQTQDAQQNATSAQDDGALKDHETDNTAQQQPESDFAASLTQDAVSETSISLPTINTPLQGAQEGANTPQTSTTEAFAHATDSTIEHAGEQFATPSDPTLSELDTTVVRRHTLLGGLPPAQTQTDPGQDEPVWQPRQADSPQTDEQNLNEQTILAGASIKPAPLSRAAAHWSALITAILAVPLAWASFNHAFGLLYSIEKSTWNTGDLSVEALGFFAFGMGALIALIVTTRLSSLGAFFTGTLLIICGLPFIVAPSAVAQFLTPYVDQTGSAGLVPRLLTYFFVSNGAGGLMLILGAILFGMGIISHSARRQGRQDSISRKALDRASTTETPK